MPNSQGTRVGIIVFDSFQIPSIDVVADFYKCPENLP